MTANARHLRGLETAARAAREARRVLEDTITAASAAGVSTVDIATATGQHRNTVYRILSRNRP